PDGPRCNYFALYFDGAIDQDIAIDMDEYPGFSVGDVVMFDAKKLVSAWGYDEVPGEMGNYTLAVDYDPAVWRLVAAAQPAPDPWSDPLLDAVSGPTTQTPAAQIRNRGSVILEKVAQ
ncbi:MAG: hypothetical protein LBV18_06715, partial [Alistipes sp.]|nr:hypothetical protein [Alistipes sp.]